MKFKIKKEMLLDELIKWALRNPTLSQGKSFFTTGDSDGVVHFQANTNKCLTSGFVPLDEPFTVDVEGKITEDTVFEYLVQVYEGGDVQVHKDEAINYVMSPLDKAFYILNDDLTMTLIWKDGRLVE
ncbi:TPA: hypothetical protein PVM76_000968 [Staphylococcus aureus]|uniref:hypothetical protein n=1 Tax=Staphylococcus aureus TaxID=1280 RepID=UPI0010921966|nr:hypothetical protein [Staphylococcus aureus]QBS02045.1 Hypothetical protein SaO55_1267 [Staphylococcus aureus]HDD3992322.1 hypothetical protein [Staphylococcus aureus]HDK8967056.1 hypothetical protein [Staphylococcus aureus]HDK8991264.1 hypothetical protein [Staphylococcus aureus]HDP5863190.1 hypothetical protein [Staphylococcus aureus]